MSQVAETVYAKKIKKCLSSVRNFSVNFNQIAAVTVCTAVP